MRKKKAADIFKKGDLIVYPAHGMGRVLGVERQKIGEEDLELLAIEFDKDRMVLRVPTAKLERLGVRCLSSRDQMRTAVVILKGVPRVRRAMWSRRAQEYEEKINSGDPVSIAEVVRDLFRKTGQSEQSYSERQIYQDALDRLAREYAAVESMDEENAARKLQSILSETAL